MGVAGSGANVEPGRHLVAPSPPQPRSWVRAILSFLLHALKGMNLNAKYRIGILFTLLYLISPQAPQSPFLSIRETQSSQRITCPRSLSLEWSPRLRLQNLRSFFSSPRGAAKAAVNKMGSSSRGPEPCGEGTGRRRGTGRRK